MGLAKLGLGIGFGGPAAGVTGVGFIGFIGGLIGLPSAMV